MVNFWIISVCGSFIRSIVIFTELILIFTEILLLVYDDVNDSLPQNR